MFFFFFNDYLEEIREAAESANIKSIINSEEYYFQKALDKYNEFKQLIVEDTILDNLIAQSNEKPFSYEKLLEKSQLNMQEYKVLIIIGELVSYIDKSAAMKNKFNEYDDKRTMAHTSVRQNIWLQSFLKLKRDINLDELPDGVKNAIRYLLEPDKTISVFSDKRKEEILNFIFQGKDGDLFECMHEIGIRSKNPMNDGYVYSAILHSKKIRKLWETDKKGNALIIDHQKTWAFAPGEDAYMWDEFIEKGIMAIGWGKVSDLKKFNTKDEMKEQLKIAYGTQSNHRNSGLALWQFCYEIQIGDKIYAKVGMKTLLGIGEVTSDYEYDDNTEEYKHVRHVKWLKTGRWELSEKFAIKTLTDITDFEEFCESLEKIVNESEPSKDETADVPEAIYELYSKQDFLSDVFIRDDQYDTLLVLLQRKKNIILQGAPGVGKTFAAKRLAYSIMGVKDEERVKVVQFHQSYSYEDFVMGYRPDDKGFSLKFGVFYKFCKHAETNPNKPYFFIIDEINRGNLSKIFGELLMLIEADKRSEKIVLTYSDLEFSVPDNVFIIGMMNTADRSLAMIDYALRRRFSFFELEPAFGVKMFEQYLHDKDVDAVLTKRIITKLNYLNNKIETDPNLGSGFRIGHSYFCDCENINSGWYETIIRYEIAPLLEEYWFDDIETAKSLIDELLR